MPIRLYDVYAKIINGEYVEAPTDYNGISNYNMDSERLIADGWKKVLFAIIPDESKQYESVYTETDTNIIEILKEIVPIVQLTKLEFVNKFTDEEFKGIMIASKNNADIELWMLKFNLATYISLEDPQTIAGVKTLEAVGLIGVGRANEILGLPPVMQATIEEPIIEESVLTEPVIEKKWYQRIFNI